MKIVGPFALSFVLDQDRRTRLIIVPLVIDLTNFKSQLVAIVLIVIKIFNKNIDRVFTLIVDKIDSKPTRPNIKINRHTFVKSGPLLFFLNFNKIISFLYGRYINNISGIIVKIANAGVCGLGGH